MKLWTFALITVLFSTQLWAAPAKVNLEPEWKGGTLTARLQTWPKGFNYYTASSIYNSMLWYMVGVTLVFTDYSTLEDIPYLAKRWEVGKDRRTFTFYLNKNAKWEDGQPITAEDVEFTYKLVWDTKRCVLCEPSRNFRGPMLEFKVIDKHTVRIKMERVHFNMLARIGSLFILPKHKYSKGNFEKDYNKVIYSGGPYSYDQKASKFRKKIVLRRNKNHWSNQYPYFAQRYNFDKIVYKYIKDATVAFEAFKRRELDIFYYELSEVEFWENRGGAPYTDKRLGTLEYERYNPARWGGIALNMRQGVNADKNVRQAMQYMFNRPLIIEKIFKNHLRMVSGPFMKGTKYSSNSPMTPFDLKKAAALLKKAGFTKAGSDGILYRDTVIEGKTVQQRASVTIMYSLETHSQWLTVFKEDAKRVGFEIVPRLVEWSAAMKKIDEFKFDAFVLGWSGGPVPGPAQLFHGRSAMSKGSSNYPGLNNKRLNELIDKGPALFNEAERYAAFQEMEKIIIEEQPYLFRWTEANHKAAYWKDKIDPTAEPFKKYSGTVERDPFYYHWRAAR